MRTQVRTPELVAEAQRLRDQGLSYREIGDVFGVSDVAAYKWLNPESAKKQREKKRKWNKENTEHRRQYKEDNRFHIALQESHRRAKKHEYAHCNAAVEQIEAAFTGFCDVCGVLESELDRKLALEHCHTTGDFRGWTCNNCNTGIGHLQEKPEPFIRYLHSDLATILGIPQLPVMPCHIDHSTLYEKCRQALYNSQQRAKTYGYLPCNATVEELQAAYTGFCHICVKHESEFKRRLAMDHCHETGEFRGWLCRECNTGIGSIRELPLRMLTYLYPDRGQELFQRYIDTARR